MKILVDNNLPKNINKILSSHNTFCVRDVLFSNATDKLILEYCIKNNFDLLITKDKNFAWAIESKNSNLKCLLVNTGNISTHNLLNHIQDKIPAIEYLIKSKEKVLII